MKTLTLDLRFMSFAYDDAGSGLPVVLLHAFPFDRTMWEEIVAIRLVRIIGYPHHIICAVMRKRVRPAASCD